MISLDKIEAQLALMQLNSLRARISDFDTCLKVSNAGNGYVNSDLLELAVVSRKIKNSIESLICSTSDFLRNYIDQMTEKDEGIAAVIRRGAEAMRGADK